MPRWAHYSIYSGLEAVGEALSGWATLLRVEQKGWPSLPPLGIPHTYFRSVLGCAKDSQILE